MTDVEPLVLLTMAAAAELSQGHAEHAAAILCEIGDSGDDGDHDLYAALRVLAKTAAENLPPLAPGVFYTFEFNRNGSRVEPEDAPAAIVWAHRFLIAAFNLDAELTVALFDALRADVQLPDGKSKLDGALAELCEILAARP